MKLLPFSGYDEYKRVQAGNKVKYYEVYAEDPELRQIAAHFTCLGVGGGNGICHGGSNGYEVQMLRRLLVNVDIIGTDISGTAASVPHCIEWGYARGEARVAGRYRLHVRGATSSTSSSSKCVLTMRRKSTCSGARSSGRLRRALTAKMTSRRVVVVVVKSRQ